MVLLRLADRLPALLAPRLARRYARVSCRPVRCPANHLAVALPVTVTESASPNHPATERGLSTAWCELVWEPAEWVLLTVLDLEPERRPTACVDPVANSVGGPPLCLTASPQPHPGQIPAWPHGRIS